MRRAWIVLGLAAMGLVRAAAARDLGEILRDKGILSADEAKEARGAAPGAEAGLAEILRRKGILTAEEAREARSAAAPAAPAAQAVASAAPPSLPEWIAKVTPFGDVRVRNESFFRDGEPDRSRQRFRLRFGANVRPNDQTQIGFRLATGASNELISNNQTFTETFTFKNVNVSNAYLKLAPGPSLGLPASALTLWGGKFDTTTHRVTPILFDGDLTPEGFSETLQPLESKTGLLRSLRLNLGQWVYQEVSSRSDGAVFAFQGVADLALARGVSATLAAGDFKFHKPSTIATARNRNASLVATNNVRLSDGSVAGGRNVDPSKAGPNQDGLDADGKPIRIAGFVSDFNEVNVGGELKFATPLPRFPLRLFGDGVINTEAAGGDDSGFQVGVSIGRSERRGDLSFRYAYERLETDAEISAFAESDFGDGGTNQKGHVLQLGYGLLDNLQLLSTAFVTEPIDEVAGRNSSTLVRWQVDLLAKF